eukprot:symbB.v1.2.032639.t1/scaffold3945.1/size47733/3
MIHVIHDLVNASDLFFGEPWNSVKLDFSERLQALLAHLLAIRSQLDSVLASQVHVQEAVLDNTQTLTSRNHRWHGGSKHVGSPLRAMNVAQAHDAPWEEDADYVQYEKADAADAAGGRYFERVSPPQVQDNLDKEVKKVEPKYIWIQVCSTSRSSRDELRILVEKAKYEETRRFTFRHVIWCEKVRTMTAKQKGALIDAMTGCKDYVQYEKPDAADAAGGTG